MPSSTMVDTATAPPLKQTSRRCPGSAAAFSKANNAGAGADAPKPKAKTVASRYLAPFSKPTSPATASASRRSASPAPRRPASAERVARSPNHVACSGSATSVTRTLSVAFQSPTYCLDSNKAMRPVSPAASPVAFPLEKRNSGITVTSIRATVPERRQNTYRWPASGRDAGVLTSTRLEHSASNNKRTAATALAAAGMPRRSSVDGANEYLMRAMSSSEDTYSASYGGTRDADKPPGVESAGQRPSPRSSSARFLRDAAMGICSGRFANPAKPVSSRTPPPAAAVASLSPVKKKKRSLLTGPLSSPFSKLSSSIKQKQQSLVDSSFRITDSPSRPRRSVELPGFSGSGKVQLSNKARSLVGDMKKVTKNQQKAEEEHQLRLLYTRHLQLRHANAKAAAAHSSKRAAAEKILYAVWMAILRARKSVAIAKLQLQLLRNN